MNRGLWILQVVLAALFLFAGAAKFVMPVDQMTKGLPEAISSGAFIHFIGACEVLGAFGLILPSLLRIKPGLTPLAAAGLLIIVIGATVVSLPQGLAVALLPAVTAILAAFVAYGRWKLAPITR
jgi:DoxX-like family